MTLRELQARREAIRTELRGLHDAANGAALAGEAQTRWDALTVELATVEAAERRQAVIDDLDRRAAGQPLGGDPRFDALTSEVRISDVIAASLGDTGRGAGLAKEASAEIARQRGRTPQGLFLSLRGLARAAATERRALTSGAQGTPPTGAALIQTLVRDDLLVDPLRAATVLAALGTTYLTGLTGNLSVPRIATGTSVGWFGENQDIPNTDVALDSVALAVKHVGAITEYSRTMLLNSSPDVDLLLRNDLMRALAVEIDRAALVGSGDGIVPRGVINVPGVVRVPFGDALDWSKVLALPAALANANVPMGRPGFIGNGLIRAKAMGTLTTPGVAGPFIMTGPGELAGYPFASTNLIPVSPATTGTGAHPARSTLVFGSFDNLLVGVWDALDLTSNPYGEAYRRGAVQVRIIADVDVAVRHAEAFAYANDVGA